MSMIVIRWDNDERDVGSTWQELLDHVRNTQWYTYESEAEFRADMARRAFNWSLTEAVVVAAPARARKPRRASWRELPAAEMAAHLLATPTITDRAWTGEPRLPRETRTAFIRRVLLGETDLADTLEGETATTDPET